MAAPQYTSDPMISFDAGTHQFHYRVAAVILRGRDVLLHQLEGDEFWALPGGRVEAGETASQAIVREFNEELGVAVECGEFLGAAENFFSYAGKPHHELGLYFAATPDPPTPLATAEGPYLGIEGERPLRFAWFDRSTLHSIDLRPRFLMDALASEEVRIGHAVQRDVAAP
jgi:ADP-ribose pyrophosphatase YjhB (NUDIX family)